MRMTFLHQMPQAFLVATVSLFLCCNLSHCFLVNIPTTTTWTITTEKRTSSISQLLDKHIQQQQQQQQQQQPIVQAHQDTYNDPLSTMALSLTKNDNDDDEKSRMIDEDQQQKKLQMEIDSIMNPPSQSNALFGGFDVDAFDESKLPLPLFSSVVIFIVTTYLTGYMFYIGIMGFPENEIVPRIF